MNIQSGPWCLLVPACYLVEKTGKISRPAVYTYFNGWFDKIPRIQPPSDPETPSHPSDRENGFWDSHTVN